MYSTGLKFRNALIENGKRVCVENPDNLDKDQLMALAAKISQEINDLNRMLSLEPMENIQSSQTVSEEEIESPKTVSKEEQKELYLNFLEWYDIVKTPTNHLYEYVLKNYPVSKFRKILCVGDGENCYLGRKLAMKGYEVISIDPVAKKEFAGVGMSEDGKGALAVVKDKFFKTSKGLINWADAIVGAKVPLCVPDLVSLPKPTAFSISANPEIYRMTFKGVSITCAEQYREMIKRCPGIRTFTPKPDITGQDMSDCMIFAHDGRQRELEY